MSDRAELDVGPASEDDAPVDVRPAAASHPLGYAVVLLGVVGFVVSCFLPFFGGPVQGTGRTVSLYDSVSLPGASTIEAFAGRLSLFAGPATVGVVSLIGITRPRRWTPYALIAGVAAWAPSWLGVVVSEWGFVQHELGYWTTIASLGVAIVGTIVVWVSSRSREREPARSPA